MEGVKLYHVNGEIAVAPKEPLPMDDTVCIPITGIDAEAIIEQLVKPIQFKYVQGFVKDLEVDAKEPHWSVNLKRGLINILHLNLLEVDILPDVPPQIFDDVKYSWDSRRTALHKFYRSMEQDLVGDCESVYAIDDTDVTPTTRMFVTKVRNYEKCKTKPMMMYGVISNIHCVDCKEEKVSYTLT